ncbi:MAG: ferritin family protein [Bacteroidota bacterium]
MPRPRHDELDWAAMSLQEILRLAIADEEEARDYYRHAAAMAGDCRTRRLLLSLSSMEQEHADTLRKELEELTLQRSLEEGIAD